MHHTYICKKKKKAQDVLQALLNALYRGLYQIILFSMLDAFAVIISGVGDIGGTEVSINFVYFIDIILPTVGPSQYYDLTLIRIILSILS
jgi:hypothetical protein